MELLVDGAEAVAEGVDADSEFIPNLFVEITPGEQGENLVFPRREAFHFGGRLLNLAEVVHDFAGDLHGHRRPAGMDLFDGFNQSRARSVL